MNTKTRYTIYVILTPIRRPGTGLTDMDIPSPKMSDDIIPITEMFKGVCDKDDNFIVDCDVSRENMNDLMLSKVLNSKTYIGYRGNERYIVKDANFYESATFNGEICNQHLASQHDIAAKVLSYWKCSKLNRGIIIMDYIEGVTLQNYIRIPDAAIVEVYLLTLKKILYQSLVLNILHSNLYNSVLVTNDDIFIDNYEKSKILTINKKKDVMNQMLPYIADWSDFTYSLTEQLYYAKGKKEITQWFTKSKLDNKSTWYSLLLELYKEHNRLPTYLEVYEEVKSLLS